MNTEPTVFDDAIMTLLAPLQQGPASGGVWWGIAPRGVGEPHIVVSVTSETPQYSLGLGGYLNIVYQVRSASSGYDAPSRASAVATTADAVLHNAQPTIAGWRVLGLWRDGSGTRYTDNDDWYNVVYYYRLVVERE